MLNVQEISGGEKDHLVGPMDLDPGTLDPRSVKCGINLNFFQKIIFKKIIQKLLSAGI